MHELASLIDYTVVPNGPNAVIDQVHFSLTESEDYWTSTAEWGASDKVYAVLFGVGDIVPTVATTAMRRVRCVSGSAKPGPADRFSIHASGNTVLDRRTNLRWQRAATLSHWSAGASACDALDLDGAGDYRLPTVRELHGLVTTDQGPPSIDGKAFPQTPVDQGFWSGTDRAGGATYAWRVGYLGGSVDSVQLKESGPKQWVRCVAPLPNCAGELDCDDGDPCTIGSCLPSGACLQQPTSGPACTASGGCPGICGAGVCKANGEPGPAASTLSLADSTTARAIGPDGNGGAALCLSGYVDKTSTAQNWLRRVDAKVEAIWQVELGNNKPGNTCAVTTVLSDGAVTALGRISSSSTQNVDFGYWKWDANGNVLTSAKPVALGFPPQASFSVSVLGHDAGGGLLAVGGTRTVSSNVNTGWAVVVDAAGGAKVFDSLPSAKAKEAEVRALIVSGSGRRFFGRAQADGGYDGVVTAAYGSVDQATSSSWIHDGLYAYAAAEASSGGWWLVVGPPGSHQLRRHDADGKLLFTRKLPENVSIRKAKGTAIGLLLAGTATNGDKAAYVARLDASGAVLWQRFVGFATTGALLDIEYTGKEVWAVGSEVLNGKSRAYLLRHDAWGRQPCTIGGCADAPQLRRRRERLRLRHAQRPPADRGRVGADRPRRLHAQAG